MMQGPRNDGAAAEAPQLWEMSDLPAARRAKAHPRARLRPASLNAAPEGPLVPEPALSRLDPSARQRSEVVLLLSIEETARALGLGRSKTYELIAAGDLETVHIGRAVRVPVDAVESFVQRLRRPREAGGSSAYEEGDE